MARRSSTTSNGRSLRHARKAARPAEDTQIAEARKRLRSLENAAAMRKKAFGDYHAADGRLGEMEDYDHGLAAKGSRRRRRQDYLNAFAVTVAWRFFSECIAVGRHDDLETGFAGKAYVAARTKVVSDYLVDRFGAVASPATIFRAVQVCGTKLDNFMVTRAMGITKAERFAAGYSYLKWCDEPENHIKDELYERKKAGQRTKGDAARRAAGKPTKEHRSKASVVRLKDLFGASKQSIYNWAALGTLTVQFDGLTLDVPQKDKTELRAKCLRLEADARQKADDKAGRAASPTPREPEVAAVLLPVVIQEPAMRDDRPIGDMPAHEFVATVVNGTTQAILGELERQREADKVAARRAEEQRLAEIVARQTQKRQSVRERAHAMAGAYLDDKMGAAERLSLDLFDCGVDGNDIATILKARAFEVGEAYDPADAERALSMLDIGMSPLDVGIALRPASVALQ